MKKSFHWSRPEDAPDEVRREIELHLELRAKEFEAQGMSPEEARRAALAAFGNRGEIESEVRELRGTVLRERQRRDRAGELLLDLKHAVRGLLRAPGFTVIALLTLGLGIGANSSIFSVVRSVLLRPLPYAESGQLLQLWTDYRVRGRATPEWLQPPEFLDWQRDNRTFSAMAAYNGWGPDLTGSGDPASMSGVAVTGNYFNVLAASPAAGRLLAISDDDPGAERVIVLSHALWRSRFGADSGILGRQLQLNGEPWTVVGVLPRDFRAPLPFVPDIYRAMRRPADSRCGRGCVTWRAIGRLKPGFTLAQARADLDAIEARLARDYPESNKDVKSWPIALHEQITGATRLPLLALTGAVGLVLLIACVNLANLLLVRGAGRARELSVRAALGAGRGRLVRQLFTESAVLALGGGGLGLLISGLGSRLLSSMVPQNVRDVQAIGVDATVMAFTAGLTLLAGLLFGLLPALHSARTDLMTALRTSGGELGITGKLRRGLVVAELALAVVLLIGAGLLLRSFLALQRVELGYRTRGVVFVPVGFPRVRYPDAPRTLTAIDDILSRTRANPAIRVAELTDLPPMNPGDQDVTAIPVGEPERPGTPESIWYRRVTPGYLDAMHLKIVAGRGLTADDRSGAPRVGVINQEAARRFFPDKSPLGRVIALGRDSASPRVTIVGLLGTTYQDGPNQPPKVEMYVPINQTSGGAAVVFLLEPKRGADAAVTAFKQALHDVDPLLPLGTVTPIEEMVGTALSLPRLYALLIGIFAGAAVLLAVLGVYGVMAYAVSQRQRELGVRLALGAGPGRIQRLVLGQGTRLALIGVGIGLVASVGLSQVIRRLLFGVGTFDLATYVLVPLILGGMALVACWLPARRAMRVDPLVAIREE